MVVQNFIKLYTAVHELLCSQSFQDAERNTVPRAAIDDIMCYTKLEAVGEHGNTVQRVILSEFSKRHNSSC